MIHKPKTIKEAIDDLQTFLECDLYTKFNPEHIIKGEKFYRQDIFKNEEEFQEYLNGHFDILRKQVKELDKHQCKKVENEGSNVFQLETQNNAEEVNRTEQRSALVDNHAGATSHKTEEAKRK